MPARSGDPAQHHRPRLSDGRLTRGHTGDLQQHPHRAVVELNDGQRVRAGQVGHRDPHGGVGVHGAGARQRLEPVFGGQLPGVVDAQPRRELRGGVDARALLENRCLPADLRLERARVCGHRDRDADAVGDAELRQLPGRQLVAGDPGRGVADGEVGRADAGLLDREQQARGARLDRIGQQSDDRRGREQWGRRRHSTCRSRRRVARSARPPPRPPPGFRSGPVGSGSTRTPTSRCSRGST